jgi:FlaA1/EpsC-like NDP-sugar epimerase
MVIGAGEAANVIIKEIVNSLYLTMQVKCIIDDDPNKWGRYIQGVRVVGGRDKIKECADLFEIDQIILAIPSAPRKEISKILDICKETNCELKTLPGVYQLVNGDVNVSRLHNVEIEDLLGRDPVTVDIDSILGYVKGKVVCVTGGGGSIGSELCRQIAGHDPKQLIIVDIYENNAYDIQQELKKKYPQLDLQVLIASVRNTNRVNWIFEHYRPQIVYHAAAHKHVPLMEDSPNEAIKNNVFGTFKTAMAAAQNGCEKFVMISTDKAVNPTNIMGASKRICEMIIQTFNRHYDTEFVAVRFGNVLGSNGSVIPLFKKQIAAGGPVTVTDPNIIRYFMTIPEAVSLVLQAGAYAKGGEIFVLDMGEPVRILDLAENLIKLSGFKVGEDIKIEFTGLRPGEKLYEEMLMDEEGLQDTANKMIHIGKPINVDESRFFEDLEKLNHASKAESANIRNIVQEIVTTYHPNINDAEQHSAEHVRELQRVAAKINATD